MCPTAFVGVMPRCLESINVAALSKMIIRSGLEWYALLFASSFPVDHSALRRGRRAVNAFVCLALLLVAADAAAFMIVPWFRRHGPHFFRH